MTVVKVGGSLFDHPSLGPGLRAWLDEIPDSLNSVLLVPGGGAGTDIVRKWDRIHGLGDEGSHVLAVRAMDLACGLLAELTGRAMFDVTNVLRDTSLPRTWAVTSDSIAARFAETRGGLRLVLLKSIDVPPGTPWAEAAANGWVDEYFPAAVSRLICPVQVVNFRRWLDENGFGKCHGRGTSAPPA
ncbi:MAG TPA: hypothetical protein VGJ05_10400 [Fimbriiglobus sp.]|jgi:aspartokinase-like uncharacterized kinase